MVKDIFGGEKFDSFDSPSVIKEFERFGTSVGMWENEYPKFLMEGKLAKNDKKKFMYQSVKINDNIKEEIKENEINKEIKEDKKEDKMEDNGNKISINVNGKNYLKVNIKKK